MNDQDIVIGDIVLYQIQWMPEERKGIVRDINSFVVTVEDQCCGHIEIVARQRDYIKKCLPK